MNYQEANSLVMWIKGRSTAVIKHRNWPTRLSWLVAAVAFVLAAHLDLIADSTDQSKDAVPKTIRLRERRSPSQQPRPPSAPALTNAPVNAKATAFTKKGTVVFTGDIEGLAAKSDKPSKAIKRPNVRSSSNDQIRPTSVGDEPALIDINRDAYQSPLWWHEVVVRQMRPDSTPVEITLEQILVRSIECSSQISVISDVPLIRRTGIVGAQSTFDPIAFMDARWDQFDNPVGNTLTTGGPTRYLNNNMISSVGMRQKNLVGGQLELVQQFGWQQTNSRFFVPNPQGNSRLALNYTQPLMQGRGKMYNESLIFLAQIDTDVAQDEFCAQLQTHLQEIVRAYWDLYEERGSLAQYRKSYERAMDVLEKLTHRIEIDAVLAQIQRAEAEVATRHADVLGSEMEVKNAESRIRSLVGDPLLGQYETVELIPVIIPNMVPTLVDPADAMAIAVQNRPEVGRALKLIKSGTVRLDMSRNELLPVLNLVTQAYVMGLEGGGSTGGAWTNQFTAGNPSYSVGLQYEVPLGLRAAKTLNERRMLELRQFRNQYETTLRTIKLEVEVAVRTVQTSHEKMVAQEHALIASTTQLDYLEKRWRLLPPDAGNGSVVLENLLIAQERVVKNENSYLDAQTTYNVSLINLKRATGEFLQNDWTTREEYREECEDIKTRLVEKPNQETTSPAKR